MFYNGDGITALLTWKSGILFLSFYYFIKRRPVFILFFLRLINDTTMCAVDGHMVLSSLWLVI